MNFAHHNTKKMLVLNTLVFLLAKSAESSHMLSRLGSYSPTSDFRIKDAMKVVKPSFDYVKDCIGHCLIDPADKLCVASCFKPRLVGLF